MDYAGAEQAFLNGQAAVLLNGTWVVDSYLSQAKKGEVQLKQYGAYTIPTLFDAPAAWTDSHVWVLPRSKTVDPAKQEIAIAFLAFLNEHSADWARTGHLPVRKSVLSSAEFLNLPERPNYSSTARVARASPPVQNQRAIGEALVQQINATWLASRAPESTLAEAQAQVQKILDRSRPTRPPQGSSTQ